MHREKAISVWNAMVVSVPGWGWGCIGVEVFRAFVAQFSVPVWGRECISGEPTEQEFLDTFPSPGGVGDASYIASYGQPDWSRFRPRVG